MGTPGAFSTSSVWPSPGPSTITTAVDVAVIGAGPIGSALAIMLARYGLRISLLEKSTFPRDKPCGEGLMPAGLAILEELGIDLAPTDFPRIRGVRYRISEASAFGAFRDDHGRLAPGAGVRRLRLDPLLARRAAEHPGVDFHAGVLVRGLEFGSGGVRLQTSAGLLMANRVVAADGIGSPVRRWMGWEKAARGDRLALVSHLHERAHGLDEIVVTVLDGTETYIAPTSPDEILAVVLGDRRSLGRMHLSQPEAFSDTLRRAHPEFGHEQTGPLLSAGPFLVQPRRVADGTVFLAGDAAGFIDPLTGDGLTAGLCASRELARLLVDAPRDAAPRYTDWHARQWKRRRLVTRLAMALSRHPMLGARAVRGMVRNPTALETLIRVNGGGRPLSTVPPRTWLALAGF